MNEADRLLMQAALDGEMDASAMAAFERRLAAEPDLAQSYAGVQALRGALRAIPVARAPERLRAKISAMAAPTAPANRFAGGAIAATIAALGIGLAVGWSAAPHGPDLDREILAGHLRGMISTHPVDVVSSDRHTVRPWFAGKLAVAPAVPDLAAAGFPLEGGRIDIVAGEPAPTLVYRAGKHTISVTRLPDVAARGFAAPSRREIEGHALLAWREGGATYVAASDAAPDELEALAAAFRKASAAAD